MSAAESLNVLRVVLVSPGDVQEERDRVVAVVDELNRQVAASHGIVVKLWRWEVDARPGLHLEGPQGLIDDRMKIEDANVVIGIFWKRFGTPVGDASSGTEHELRQAWASWNERRRPDVMVYFNTSPARPTTVADTEQWGRVIAFREELPETQLWWSYEGISEFEQLVRRHLTDVVLRHEDDATDYHERHPWTEAGRLLFNIPRVAAAFTGREDELSALGHALDASGSAVITQAITGLGGVGKSQLAAAFVHRHLDDYDVVAWIRAEDGGAADMAELATKLGLPVDGKSLEERARLAIDWLSATSSRWLLVLDNVTTPAQLSEMAPTTGCGHVLVTSRHGGMGQFGAALSVDVFDDETAASYLIERAGRPHDREAARRLARALGGLPLALSHAGAYCMSGTAFDEFLGLLEELPAQELFSSAPEESYAQTVASTWKVSIVAAGAEAALALPVLETAAFFASEAIPKSLFLSGLDHADAGVRKAVSDAINGLARFSLVTAMDETISVHRLLQKVVRDAVAARGDVLPARRALAALLSHFDVDVTDPETWGISESLVPHVAALTHNLPYPTEDDGEGLVVLLNRACHYLNWAGRHASAPAALVDAAVRRSRELLGAEHPQTLVARNREAFSRRQAGDTASSIKLFEQLAADSERILGPEASETLRTRQDLVAAYACVGRFDEAIEMGEPLVAVQERILGRDSTLVLSTRHELGAAYLRSGRVEEARHTLEELVEDRARLLGAEHPSTLAARETLAEVWDALGDTDKAVRELEELLPICERVLGPLHPQSRLVIAELGVRYSIVGRHEEAIRTMEVAVERFEAALGREHRRCTTICMNHAWTLNQAGRRAEATAAVRTVVERRGRTVETDDAGMLRARQVLEWLEADAEPRAR